MIQATPLQFKNYARRGTRVIHVPGQGFQRAAAGERVVWVPGKGYQVGTGVHCNGKGFEAIRSPGILI